MNKKLNLAELNKTELKKAKGGVFPRLCACYCSPDPWAPMTSQQVGQANYEIPWP